MSTNQPQTIFELNSKELRLKNNVAYNRLLLKLSGEYFAGSSEFGFDDSKFEHVAAQIKTLNDYGVEVALVIGGGNIFRGAKASEKIDRPTADTVGMLATVMNGLYMQSHLEAVGVKTRLMSSITMPYIAESYIRRRSIRHLEKGRVVIFAAGTGNPFFTTDTAAVLRGREINADIVVKCTNVDGIYDKDPKIHTDAKKFETLQFQQALNSDLKVMDATAFSFSQTHKLCIYVLDIDVKNSIVDFALGQGKGTLVQ